MCVCARMRACARAHIPVGACTAVLHRLAHPMSPLYLFIYFFNMSALICQTMYTGGRGVAFHKFPRGLFD